MPPFITCLIGVPLNEADTLQFNTTLQEFRRFWNVSGGHLVWQLNNISSWIDRYDYWDDHLPIGPPPQEIELVDSLNVSYCLFINATAYTCAGEPSTLCNVTVPTPVSPIGNTPDWGSWCKHFHRNRSHAAPGTVYPRRLPPGIFLICGNRAWNGIPSMPVGGVLVHLVA